MFPAKGSWEIKALPLAGTHLLSDLLGLLLPVSKLPQNPTASGYLLAEPALLGIFSSQPVDEDMNGLYEYLEVTAAVDVTGEVSLSLSARLEGGDGQFIDQASARQDFTSTGRQTMLLRFSGEMTRNSRIN